MRITHAGLCGSDLFLDMAFHSSRGEPLKVKKGGGLADLPRHYFRHGGLGSFKTPMPMYMGHEPAPGLRC